MSQRRIRGTAPGEEPEVLGAAPATHERSRADTRVRRRAEIGDWEAVVERFAPYVYAVAVSGHRLPEDEARAVFEEIFLRAWLRRDEFAAGRPAYPWFVQVVHELAGGSPSGEADREELQRLDDALAASEAAHRLPPALRRVVTRILVDGAEEVTVASEMGIPTDAVRALLQHARQRLRRSLLLDGYRR